MLMSQKCDPDDDITSMEGKNKDIEDVIRRPNSTEGKTRKHDATRHFLVSNKTRPAHTAAERRCAHTHHVLAAKHHSLSTTPTGSS
jgi:hypothetical protein